MEINKVEEIPTSNKGMNENALKVLEALKEMEVGTTLEFKDKERTPQSMVSSVKNLTKRLKSTCKFTVRVRGEAVYVVKEDDITKKPKETPKEDTKKSKK